MSQKNPRVLGIDPGFANVGWCVVSVWARGELVIEEMGVIRTEKGKGRITAAYDEHRRAKEICRALDKLIRKHNISLLTEELISSGMQNSRTQRLNGYCYGILSTLCELHTLPMVGATPKEIKKELCGKSAVSDLLLHDALGRRHDDLEAKSKHVVASKREHCYDALGSIEACKDKELFMAVRRLASCR